MIFSVKKDLTTVDKITSETFSELNIWERQNIQEWIREYPEILGEDLLIVSTEFDRFKGSNDRLDVLAIDRDGNLVVVELKRTSLGEYADLQGIRYAAMVSSMTMEDLIPYYTDYRKKYLSEAEADDESCITNIQEFVNADNFKELSNNPRIILGSEDFSQELTTTVLWLNQNSLDISCVRIKPYKLSDQIIIVPNKIIPLKEAEEYLVKVQKKEQATATKNRYRPKSMSIIMDNGLLKDGDQIYLKKDLPEFLKFKDGEPKFIATITGKKGQSNAVRWGEDSQEYSISGLTWKIFTDAHPEGKTPSAMNGNWHWVTKKGKTLWDLADAQYKTQNQS
jgi:hypothetical protein